MIKKLYIFLGLCENILSTDNIEEQNQRLLCLCNGLLEQICNTVNVSVIPTCIFSRVSNIISLKKYSRWVFGIW